MHSVSEKTPDFMSQYMFLEKSLKEGSVHHKPQTVLD